MLTWSPNTQILMGVTWVLPRMKFNCALTADLNVSFAHFPRNEVLSFGMGSS